MISFLTESKTLVILDAGHGVTTPGKRSPVWSDGSQLMEYEFNRKITHYIYEFLKAAGISCIVITNDDTDIPLKNRVSSINSLYDSNKSKYFVYAVSIHGNAADNVPSANGIEVYTTKGVTKSDSIAEKWGQTSVSFSREVGPAIAWPHCCTETKTAFRKVTGRRSV